MGYLTSLTIIPPPNNTTSQGCFNTQTQPVAAAHFLGTRSVPGSTLSALSDWSLSIVSMPVRLHLTEKTKPRELNYFCEVTE